MYQIPSPKSDSFREFRSVVLQPSVVETLATASGLPMLAVRDRLTTSLAEAAQTLRVLAGTCVPEGGRVLEVGAGLGLTSAFLSRSGLDVTALEPAGSGFEDHELIAPALATAIEARQDTLGIGAEALRRDQHGRFDLIFSNNVLEHVPDLGAVLAAMAGVMSDEGCMVHSCPNYTIPFEPHFGVPLVPLRPALTARILPASMRDTGLWHSLNFVRAADIVADAEVLGMVVTFRRGLLAASIDRLTLDPEFRSRHRLLARVGSVVSALGVTAALRRLPPRFSTPMDFMLTKRDMAGAPISRWLAAER